MFKFDNIGTRIKLFAKRFFIASFIIEAVAAVVSAIGGVAFFIDEGSGAFAFLIILLLPVALFILAILCYIPCMFLYGFGQLIENTESKQEIRVVYPFIEDDKAWDCANCGARNAKGTLRCSKCNGVRLPSYTY